MHSLSLGAGEGGQSCSQRMRLSVRGLVDKAYTRMFGCCRSHSFSLMIAVTQVSTSPDETSQMITRNTKTGKFVSVTVAGDSHSSTLVASASAASNQLPVNYFGRSASRAELKSGTDTKVALVLASTVPTNFKWM